MDKNEDKKATEGKTGPKVNNLFLLKDFPFVFTLILGFVGFQYNEIYKTVKERPVIEYTLSVDSAVTANDTVFNYYLCSFRNISSKTKFKSITTVFAFKEETADLFAQRLRSIYAPSITTISPSSLKQPERGVTDDSAAVRLTISNFQPNTEYRLSFITKQPKGSILEPFIYIDCEETVFVQKRSWWTMLFQNQLIVNAVILGVLLIVLFRYSIILLKKHAV